MRPPVAVPQACACLLAVAVIAAGCGDLGGGGRPKIRPLVVSPADIASSPEGSPERAFLGWFRALQRKDAWNASKYYLPRLGVTWSSFAIQREQAAYALDGLAPPRILSTRIAGRRARVRIRFRSGGVAPNGKTHLSETDKATFILVRAGGAWKLFNNRYLELLARTGKSRAARLRADQTG